MDQKILIFIAVGLLTSGLDLIIFYTMLNFFGLGVLSSNSVSYGINLAVNYYLHSIYTFRTQITLTRLFRFCLVVALNYIIASPILFVGQHTPIGIIYWKIVSMAVVAWTGFWLGKKWTFS